MATGGCPTAPGPLKADPEEEGRCSQPCPAVLLQKRRKVNDKGLALDPQVRQLAEGLEMPVEELLEELPAMLADDKAVEAGEGGDEEEGSHCCCR